MRICGDITVLGYHDAAALSAEPYLLGGGKIEAAGPSEPEPKAVLLFTAAFCIVSASMAQILKTNYANYYSCNIPPLEAIRVSLQAPLGYVFTQILYVIIVSLLNFGFVLMCYYLYKLLFKLVQGRKAQAVSTT